MNKYKKLVSNTLIFAIGSFGSKILLLLLTRLYTGNINPGDNSTKELLEKVEALELQQKNTKIAMEQMQAQIAALQAKLGEEGAR